jgi:hypothetical protein
MIKCTELDFNPRVQLYENNNKIIYINRDTIRLIRLADFKFNEFTVYKVSLLNDNYYMTVISEDIDKMF